MVVEPPSLDEEDHRRYGCGKIVGLLGSAMVTKASRLLGFVQYGESSFVILELVRWGTVVLLVALLSQRMHDHES